MDEDSLIIDNIHDFAKLQLDEKNVTIPDIIKIVEKLMEYVEKIKSIKGKEKRQLVLNAIKKLVDENIYNEAIRDYVDTMINTDTLGTIIDTICYVNKNGLSIKTVKNSLLLCCIRK